MEGNTPKLITYTIDEMYDLVQDTLPSNKLSFLE